MKRLILVLAAIVISIVVIQAARSTQVDLVDNITDQFGRVITYEATNLRYQGDLSDTLLVDQLKYRNTNGEWVHPDEVIVTMEYTDVNGTCGVALEGCTELPGLWMNLRHKGLETTAAADTLAYRYIGVQDLYAIRFHFMVGDSATVVPKIKFGK